MAGELFKNSIFHNDIYPQNATTDAVNGAGVALDGWNHAQYVLSVGLPVDSDNTMVFNLQKNTVTNVASDAASTDWSNLSTDTLSITFADTSTAASDRLFVGKVDLQVHGLTTGLLRGTITLTGESDTCPISSAIIFTRRSGRLPLTSDFVNTVKEWTT